MTIARHPRGGHDADLGLDEPVGLTEDDDMASDDRRLEELKRRLGHVPKRVQRSIDRYRVSMGRRPLWAVVDVVDRRCRPTAG